MKKLFLICTMILAVLAGSAFVVHAAPVEIIGTRVNAAYGPNYTFELEAGTPGWYRLEFESDLFEDLDMDQSFMRTWDSGLEEWNETLVMFKDAHPLLQDDVLQLTFEFTDSVIFLLSFVDVIVPDPLEVEYMELGYDYPGTIEAINIDEMTFAEYADATGVTLPTSTLDELDPTAEDTAAGFALRSLIIEGNTERIYSTGTAGMTFLQYLQAKDNVTVLTLLNLIPNGNFSSNVNGFDKYNGDLVWDNGMAKLSGLGGSTYSNIMSPSVSVLTNDVIYWSVLEKQLLARRYKLLEV